MNKLFLLVSLFFVILAVLIFLFLRITFTPLGLHLPSVTYTKIGFFGDPIDVIVVGDRTTLINAFSTAGWLLPDPTTARTTEKIIQTAILNKAYPTAPISNLYLFNRKEDIAFEYPTRTVRKRHHVRFWLTSYNLNNKPVWVGADTYDSRIELSHRVGLPTHHIDPNITAEVNFLVDSLAVHGQIMKQEQVRLSLPNVLGFNGNGDWYYDSGLVEVLFLQG